MPRKGPLQTDMTPPVHLVEPVELPLPPEHLSPTMQKWWREVTEAYSLEPHHLHQLELACDAYDRAVAARELLLEEGLTVRIETGSKAHPAVAIERDSRAAFLTALRELDLDCPEAPAAPYMRPPAIRSNRRR
jgi:P27 family predicted phage terminase small subunit